ncbi:MAG: DUF362 domain-containing protein [Bryobacterales bacterium]|nr:DUF362 domain-containing protein [Bryobacterales bacterium]
MQTLGAGAAAGAFWPNVARAQSVAQKSLPATPVAVARCASYDEDLPAILRTMADQIGGLAPIVKGKTVSIKLNLTGSPALRFQGRPLGNTHYTHPKTAAVLAALIAEAGAARVRFVESCWGTGGPMQEFLLESGWNVRSLQRVAPKVEFVNTNALANPNPVSDPKRYARFKVPGQPLLFPAYDLHPTYAETDVLVSMAKLKDHATTGVTLAMKNIFGCTPCSIYGDDAGVDEPNEKPASGRGAVCHAGQRQPSRSAPSEIDPNSIRDPHHRMPRIVAELNAALPIGLSFIDGVETMRGGEGPWVRKVDIVQPGLLILGTNAVNADAVATALMGYDPRTPHHSGVFANCDNQFLLAEQLGIGTADPSQIDVRGLSIKEGVFRFGSA